MQDAGPRKPGYSEGEDEAPRLIEQEPADIERETPEVENTPIEDEPGQEPPEPPLFEQ